MMGGHYVGTHFLVDQCMALIASEHCVWHVLESTIWSTIFGAAQCVALLHSGDTVWHYEEFGLL